jgi:hypothetical protein
MEGGGGGGAGCTISWAERSRDCPLLLRLCRLEEQQEVEGYYVQKGWLLPKFHKTYFMGKQGPGSRLSHQPPVRGACALGHGGWHTNDCASTPRTGLRVKERPEWMWNDPLAGYNDTSYKHWGVNATDGSQVRPRTAAQPIQSAGHCLPALTGDMARACKQLAYIGHELATERVGPAGAGARPAGQGPDNAAAG